MLLYQPLHHNAAIFPLNKQISPVSSKLSNITHIIVIMTLAMFNAVLYL